MWIWVIIIGIILFLVLGQMVTNKTEKLQEEKGVLYTETWMKYLGGLPNKEAGKNAFITLFKDRVELLIGTDKTTILNHNLISAEIKSEFQITNEVNLGKLLIFGVLAFGMKDAKDIVRNYLVITYKDNSKQQSVVLLSKQLEQTVSEINKLIKH